MVTFVLLLFLNIGVICIMHVFQQFGKVPLANDLLNISQSIRDRNCSSLFTVRRIRRPRYQRAIFRSSTRLSIYRQCTLCTRGGVVYREATKFIFRRSRFFPKNASHRPASAVSLAPSQRSVVRRSERRRRRDT